MTNDSPHRISELRALYDKADQFAREVTEFRAAIAIPAYNQLRYAGHHLLQAIDDDGSISNEEQFRRAVSHCERAMYEAAEAGILSALESISRFQKDYKNIVVKDVVDGYARILAHTRKAQDLIAHGRSDQIPSSERASRYMETFRQLREDSDLLEASRDDLNTKRFKQAEDKRQFIAKQAQDNRRFLIKCLLTLLGITVAAAGIVVTLAK